MADIPWPTTVTKGFAPERFDETLEFDVRITVARNGRVQTQSLPGARWRAVMTFPNLPLTETVERRALFGFLATLRGGADRLLLWSLTRPFPLGTQRGLPQLWNPVNAGDTVATLSGGTTTGGLATLRAGDFMAWHGQRVMVTADALSNGSTMQVFFQPARLAYSGATTPVVMEQPVTRYVLASPNLVMPAAGADLPGFGVELVEA